MLRSVYTEVCLDQLYKDLYVQIGGYRGMFRSVDTEVCSDQWIQRYVQIDGYRGMYTQSLFYGSANPIIVVYFCLDDGLSPTCLRS